MSGIYGALGLAPDSSREYLNTIGQDIVWDAARAVVEGYARAFETAQRFFVEKQTEEHTLRYQLAGGGYLQRVTKEGRAFAVKATGKWDVAFPLEDFGAQIAGDRVSLAYMRMEDLDRHLDTVFAQDSNTRRYEILKAILNNAARTFVDEHKGSLTIQPLANGDGVLYPPVKGSDTEAAENHYIESGYASGSISDTNNPLITIIDELDEHFGVVTGGNNNAILINNLQTSKIEALTEFVPVTFNNESPGQDTATVTGIPSELLAMDGKVIGTYRGAWIMEWRWMPANYLFGRNMNAPAPLLERIDPKDTGLSGGLKLVSEEEVHPWRAAIYDDRFGYGTGNRLNGVVIELGTGGTYTVPAGY